MTAVEYKVQLEERAFGEGARIFGVADVERLSAKIPDLFSRVKGTYARAIVVGVPLSRAVLEGLQTEPSPLYAHHYMQVNYLLDRIALRLAQGIEEWGFSALPIPASQVVANHPLQGHLSHKVLGQAAGLGFIGRSTLLVNPRYGAQVRYASVLTSLELATDTPLEQDCGACHACLEACPAQAIHEQAREYDVTACHARLQQFSRLPFVGHQICGLCVKACGGRGR